MGICYFNLAGSLKELNRESFPSVNWQWWVETPKEIVPLIAKKKEMKGSQLEAVV